MKTRILHTKFWKDSFVASLSSLEKLLYIYLLTNEYVNVAHCYECSTRQIQFDTGVGSETIEKFKTKLRKAHKADFFQDYIYLRNAKKYEEYLGPKNDGAKQKILDQMSDEVKYWYSNTSKDTPIDTPIDRDYKSEIINHKSEIINQKGISTNTVERKLTPQQEVIQYVRKLQGIEHEYPNYGKQVRALKSITDAGYSLDDVRYVAQEMVKEDYWIERKFDLQNILNNIHKYGKKTPKRKVVIYS